MNFLICGLLFWLYAYIKFMRTKIFYPSIIFSFMWGGACIYLAAILNGYGKNLFLKEYYIFHHMDGYVVFFTIATLFGIFLAHMFKKNDRVNLRMDHDFIDRILHAYKWVMWINFFGGILRMAVMINTVGMNNMMDYRLAANAMMMSSSFTFAGIVFKLTAYIQMLANFYVGLYGLKTGFENLNFKKTLGIFILYAPTQMATGGRLFILYFILFFFGAFLLGRGIAMREQGRKFLKFAEKRVLIFAFAGLLGLIVIIAMLRGGGVYEDKETTLEKFSYITEGVLATEYLMEYYPKDTYKLDYGKNTMGSLSEQYLKFRGYLLNTKMSSIVVCIFTGLYLDFGYWGSIFMMFLFVFVAELLSLRALNKMNLLNFCIYMLILKMLYESVMTPSISANIANLELVVFFALFYKSLFGRFETSKKYNLY